MMNFMLGSSHEDHFFVQPRLGLGAQRAGTICRLGLRFRSRGRVRIERPCEDLPLGLKRPRLCRGAGGGGGGGGKFEAEDEYEPKGEPKGAP